MPTVITQGAASAKGYGFGARATAANYIEDVFSTYLYKGNGSSTTGQTITNNVDLSTKGGLVWIKCRDGANNHVLFDTARGAGTTASNNQALSSNLTSAEDIGSSIDYLSSFNTDGFTVKAGGTYPPTLTANTNNTLYASWTFRKQAKFFDVVTYTGNGINGTAISHNLGSVPGCIIIKRTDTTGDWYVYHRSYNGGVNPEQYTTYLNLTNAVAGPGSYSQYQAPTSTAFYPGGAVNAVGGSAKYVAYLFAHDAGGFGAAGTDNVISCGSFTTSSGVSGLVNIGFEPQWVLIKRTDSATLGDWQIYDNMRGVVASNNGGTYAQSSQKILPNSSAAEATDGFGLGIYQQGFNFNNSSGVATYIYIAIRRGPMKTPTSGTSVFSPNIATTTIQSGTNLPSANFPVDMLILGQRNGTGSIYVPDRLRGGAYLTTPSTAAESASLFSFASMTNVIGTGNFESTSNPFAFWQFRRAPGFFDVVCYTGTGANTTQNHNLGVTPELMIVKRRSTGVEWAVYHSALGATKWIELNNANAASTSSFIWNDTAPTASVFSIGINGRTNGSGSTYVAYLFATVVGVSKVGSYTGSGTTKQIDCGFTGGARFVLIKRTDSTGDWYVWDSARGIVAGNDPYLLLNSTAAEVTGTDYIDTYSAGFEISSTAPAAINANGGSFIFLAIA